jgi:hypothetical protein
VHKDFSGWDVAMALLVISAHATRFLYGDGPVNGRDAARRDLSNYERRAVAAAKQWLGYTDQPPALY